MADQWGRKETIVWPPQQPMWTWCGVFIGVVCTLLLCLQQIHYAKPLQRLYVWTYAKSTLFAAVGYHSEHRLLYIAGSPVARAGQSQHRTLQPALNSDVEDGYTPNDGHPLPVQLSELAKVQGFRQVFLGPLQKYDNHVFVAWLQAEIYDGQSVLALFLVPFAEGAVILLPACCLGGYYDVARRKRMKYGRLLKGPEMVSPAEFNKRLGGDGMGIRTDGKGLILRIPKRSEPKHIQIMGDTGVGKSTLVMQMLRQIEERDELAIVYDPSGEMIQRFYRKDRHDWVLNPLDARCPYWSPSSELRTPAEARTIAASLYQPTSDKKGEFFTETPQKIFAHLLKYRPSPQDLVAWMSHEGEIDARVAGTELATIIAKGAQQQRSGVLASLGLIADSLRLLPTKEQAEGREWSVTDWTEKRKGWIFLTGTEAELEALRPLHSLWIDLLILRNMTLPKPGQKRAWFVLDEVATLQRLPQFHAALTKGRKSENPIIFTYQGKAQIEVSYGHLAQTMLSQPSTKFVLKTAEPDAAKWASQLIGDVEIERFRETMANGQRAGKSFSVDRQVEPLVMPSEIGGLSDLHAFVKQDNYVSRFSFPHMDLPIIAEALVKRGDNGEDFWLETPKKPEADTKTATVPKPQHSSSTEPPGNLSSQPPLPRDGTPRHRQREEEARSSQHTQEAMPEAVADGYKTPPVPTSPTSQPTSHVI